jgi:hypothetical protein
MGFSLMTVAPALSLLVASRPRPFPGTGLMVKGGQEAEWRGQS